MLKNWILISWTCCILWLGACSTPQQLPQKASESVPVTPFVSYTNQVLREPQVAETNSPPPVQPLVTNLPSQAAQSAARLTQTNAITNTPPVTVKSAPTNGVSGPKWLSCESWSQSSGWTNLQRVRNVGTWTYELRSASGVLQITAGNRTAIWNGLNLDLGFVPHLANGQPYVHSLDVAKTFEPLLQQPALLYRTNRVLVIDPGHGGDNFGAKSAYSDRYEKEFALDWAMRLHSLLRTRGWKVHLTRTNDVDLSLPERVAFAEAVHADLFISLHFNSSDQPQGRSDHGGLETYCLTPTGMPSSLTRSFEDDLNSTFPNNLFDAENYYYAVRLHSALVRATQRKDRGVRRARFMGVLRNQNRVAVLIEGGYLTYAPEARLIATAEYRQKLAEAVANALSEPGTAAR